MIIVSSIKNTSEIPREVLPVDRIGQDRLTSAVPLRNSWLPYYTHELVQVKNMHVTATSVFACCESQEQLIHNPQPSLNHQTRTAALISRGTSSRQHHGPQNSPLNTMSNLPGNRNLTGNVIELALFGGSEFEGPMAFFEDINTSGRIQIGRAHV